MNLKSLLYSAQLGARLWIIGKYYDSRSSPKGEIDAATFRPKRVLVILAGLIGDSVMSLPAISEARKLWPNAHIAVLGKKHNRELITACPIFDEFYECNADPFSIRRSDEIKKLKVWLSEQRFDIAIILLGDQFAHLLAKARIPIRVGVAGTPLQNCLTVTYDIGSPRTWGTDERLNSLRCLGYNVRSTTTKLWVDESVKSRAREKLAELGIVDDENYAVLHPFGSSRRQWWPIENIPHLANLLHTHHCLRTVLIGGKETSEVDISTSGESIIDTRGLLSLQELLAVIDRAKVVITTDSGPFHISGALGKSIIGLFRARRPEHATTYSTSRVIFGRDDGCNIMCEWDSCADSNCRQMQRITVKQIAAVCKDTVTK